MTIYYIANAPSGTAVPSEVTPYKAKMALADAGLLDAVEALMVDPATPLRTRLAWKEALGFERHSDMILSAAALLGLSDAQLDALFVAAAQIN